MQFSSFHVLAHQNLPKYEICHFSMANSSEIFAASSYRSENAQVVFFSQNYPWACSSAASTLLISNKRAGNSIFWILAIYLGNK